MKARIPIYTAAQKKQARAELEREYLKIAEKERNDMSRRIIKTIIFVMNDEFGFGRDRNERLFKRFTETLEKSDKDEVYWEHIDRVVIEKLGFPFERDYTENGQVISESDYNKKINNRRKK